VPQPAPARLRVGAPPTFARNLLIPRLPDFYRQWPDIEIEVAVQAPLQDKPPRHDVDIRFGNGRFDERPATRLFEDRLLVLAAPRYRSERALHAPADLQRAELLRSPLLPWRPWFAAAGLDWPEPARGPSFTDLGILLEAAASGLGVALCTRRLAAHWTASGQLQPLFALGLASPSSYYALVEPQAAAQRAEVAAFLDWLGNAFSESADCCD
jgi:LysR family glycine cleavage system transcriptional activator